MRMSDWSSDGCSSDLRSSPDTLMTDADLCAEGNVILRRYRPATVESRLSADGHRRLATRVFAVLRRSFHQVSNASCGAAVVRPAAATRAGKMTWWTRASGTAGGDGISLTPSGMSSTLASG